MRKQDLAYMAGLLDMRFTASFSALEGRRATFTLRAAVTGRLNVADWLQQTLGAGSTTITRNAGYRHPCTTHCKTAHQHMNASTAHTYKLTGVRAAIVLENCEPFLMRWNDFAVHLDDFRMYWGQTATPDSWAKAAPVITEMRRLGWEIPDWLKN